MKPRKLTKKEIRTIILRIQYAGCIIQDIQDNITTRARQQCIQDLAEIVIHPTKIQELGDRIVAEYNHTRVSAGESVGVITAQSIGEKNTQSTLNTFHKAGLAVASVVTGVPRFSELMSATKNPKGTVTTIFFTTRFESIKELKAELYPLLVHTSVHDITLRLYRRIAPRSWYNAYARIHPVSIPENFVCVSIQTRLNILFDRRLTLEDACTIIQEAFPTTLCIPSPEPLGIIDVWSDDADDKFMKKLRTLTLKGVIGLGAISYMKGDDGSWNVVIEGCNLKELFQLPFVDSCKTFSNHVWEVFFTLGIEATREFLITEFNTVVASDGYINMRHIYLLVDAMTYTGSVSSISRFGVHRNQSGPLTKASFEKTVDNFLKSALHGELDTIKGVSSAIVCGKPSIAGTGLVQLLYDDCCR